MKQIEVVLEISIPASEFGQRLRSQVAEPGRSWLSPAYQREPWLEGRVSETEFTVWLKRPQRGGPLARARGRITQSESGCTVAVTLPKLPRVPGTALAAALLGWLVSFPILLLGIAGQRSIPWIWPIPLAFGLCGMVLLLLSAARAEAEELERYLASIFARIHEHAA